MLPNPPPSREPVAELLVVDTDAGPNRYILGLRQHYRVTATATAAAALNLLGRTLPALVLTELDFSDGQGEDICRRAKSLATPATVLVTTPHAERVPSALAAGCDGVLLKPFAPNLLYARIGRLLRARSIELRLRAHRQYAKSAHLREQGQLLTARTNREWPSTFCPYCEHRGITSFEHTSHRRSWYACMACNKVWIARRLE